MEHCTRKDKDLLNGIVRAVKCPLSQGCEGRKASSAFIRSEQYSIFLEVQDVYESKGYHNNTSNEYYKKTVWLWNHQNKEKHDFTELPFYTGQALVLAKERLQVVKAMISKMTDEQSGLQQLIGSKY